LYKTIDLTLTRITIVDISCGNDTLLPAEFIKKIKSLNDADDINNWEFEQEDYEVDLLRRLKVVKVP